jgi:hypothetical protein
MSDLKSDRPIATPAPAAVDPQAESPGFVPRGHGMGAVLAERQGAVDEARFRMTGGAAGTPPLARVVAQRQHAAANAVHRVAIQRKARGGAGAGTVPKGNGSALPGATRQSMEKELGSDLSNVRIHTGAESEQAASGFGARAFTVGQDVHFNAGEFKPGTKEGDKLLAHELTHTVQAQKSGIQRKAEPEAEGGQPAEAGEKEEGGADVSQPGEPAEQEADAVADKVGDKLHGAKKDAKGEGEAGAEGKDGEGAAKAEAPAEQAPPIAAKLEGIGLKIYRAPPLTNTTITDKWGSGATTQGAVNLTGQSMAENPEFEKDAIAFEQNLGPLAFSSGAGTASSLVGKARAYIESKVPADDFKNLGAETKKILEACASGATFAGSVGPNADTIKQLLLTSKELDDMVTAAAGDTQKLKSIPEPGNLREQMTFVYNFANKVLTPQLATDKAKVLELAGKAKMDQGEIQKRAAFMKEQAEKKALATGKPAAESGWDALGMVPQGAKADTVGGEAGAAGKTPQAVSSQWSARENRNKVEKEAGQAPTSDATTKTAGQAQAQGVGLSGREKEAQGITGPGDTLKWSEGAKVWVINEKDKWVQAMRALSLPLAAGPSGTTNALMNAAAMLGGAEPQAVRMACIGYLLPIKAHSLVEVLAAASAHGVGFTAGKKMYRDLKPLTEDQLRGCGRPGPEGKKLFPDEAPAPPVAAGPAAPGGAKPAGPPAPGGAKPGPATPAKPA